MCESNVRAVTGLGTTIPVSYTHLVTAFFLIMPGITFSGFGFPIATMPQWLQYVTYLIPLRYFLVVLRGVYLKGVGMDILWPQMAAMAALGFSLLTFACLLYTSRCV